MEHLQSAHSHLCDIHLYPVIPVDTHALLSALWRTHTLVFFFGVGFWTGCASWASEASCYFELMRYGCAPSETVDFKSIDATIEEAEAAAAADGEGT